MTKARERTLDQLSRRLSYCERKMDKAKGDAINLQWVSWMGEWSDAYYAVEDIADEMSAARRAAAKKGRK